MVKRRNLILKQLNGYTGIVATVLAGLILWVVSSFHGSLKSIEHNMVYKCDYEGDKEVLTAILYKLDDRIRDIERNR